jgi:hypothetical protein
MRDLLSIVEDSATLIAMGVKPLLHVDCVFRNPSHGFLKYIPLIRE